MTRNHLLSLFCPALNCTIPYLSLSVFHRIADLSCEIIHTERFPDKIYLFLQHALTDNDIFCVPGHEKNFNSSLSAVSMRKEKLPLTAFRTVSIILLIRFIFNSSVISTANTVPHRPRVTSGPLCRRMLDTFFQLVSNRLIQ